MAGLFTRIKSFLRSPKGKQTTTRARSLARDPRNRERARQAARRFRGRR